MSVIRKQDEERIQEFVDEVGEILAELYNADEKAEEMALKKAAAGKTGVEYERARAEALEGICFQLHGRLTRAMKEGLGVEYWMSL